MKTSLCSLAIVGALALFGTSAAPPLNLIVAQRDVNGLPLNPQWNYQSASLGAPSLLRAEGPCARFHRTSEGVDMHGCTSDGIAVDERSPGAILPPLAFACAHSSPLFDRYEDLDTDSVHGHLNWGTATYTGTLSLHDFAADGDWDFMLEPSDHYSGLLAGNRVDDNDGLTVETNDREVFGALTGSPWWSTLRARVGRHDTTLHLGRAVVIGLFGIDTKHLAHTELHPVYGLAVNVTDPRDSGRQTWEIFARNWGYEGACSRLFHVALDSAGVPINALAFALPREYSGGTYAVEDTQSYGRWSVEQTACAVIVHASLPPPASRAIQWLHLELKRT